MSDMNWEVCMIQVVMKDGEKPQFPEGFAALEVSLTNSVHLSQQFYLSWLIEADVPDKNQS